MNLDRRDMPVTCQNQSALDLYEQALFQYHSYLGDPIASIDQALQLQEDFLLAYLFKAGVLMTFSEQRFAVLAQECITAAERLQHRGNEREQALLMAVKQLATGEWRRASSLFDQILVDYPRDAFVIQTAHLYDFYQGDALNLRNRVMRTLPHWSPDFPSYSYILGMYAFGLEECNQYEDAELMADRALELERRDAWAIHAKTHVYEMQGKIEEGTYWLESRLSDWAPDNCFAFHNWWHLALFYFDRGNYQKVLEIYDEKINQLATDMSLILLDGSSLLWRMQLMGLDVADRAKSLAEIWEAKLETERDFYVFNDIHALMAFILADKQEGISRVFNDLEMWQTRHIGSSNATMIQQVGLPLARALLAFHNERWQTAVDELLAVRDRTHFFGGSHAQRDVFTLTLIEAALRAGKMNLARHFIAERNVLRAGSALGWRLHAASMDLGDLSNLRGTSQSQTSSPSVA